MAETFSSTLGDAESDIAKRKEFIAKLRGKLGEESASLVKEEGHVFSPPVQLDLPETVEVLDDDPIEYLSEYLYAHAQSGVVQDVAEASQAQGSDAFNRVFAQMDRGLDERRQLIDALKGQLAHSAAAPKIAPPLPPVAVRVAAAGASPKMPAVIDLDMELAVVGGRGTMLPSDASTTALPAPEVVHEEPAMPAPKRMRLETCSDASASTHPPQSLHMQSQLVPPVAVEPTVAAEAAELAARKAAMLRKLQAAETMDQPEVPTPPTLSSAVASSSTDGIVEATHSIAWPEALAVPAPNSDAVAPDFPPEAKVSACPPGASPEQYEAYRRQCWQQYYEYVSVWKKYYSQNLAEQSGKGSTGFGKAKGKLRPPSGSATHPGGMLGMPMSAGKGGCGMQPPRAMLPPVSVNPAAGLISGQGGLAAIPALRPPPGASGVPGIRPPGLTASRPAVAPMEDIHSKLLGL